MNLNECMNFNYISVPIANSTRQVLCRSPDGGSIPAAGRDAETPRQGHLLSPPAAIPDRRVAFDALELELVIIYKINII